MIMSTKEICKRGLSMTISLTLGNTGLPLGDRLAADVHLPGQGLLAHPGPPAVFSDPLTQRGHGHTSFQTLCYQNSTPLTTNYPATIGCKKGFSSPKLFWSNLFTFS